MVKFKSSMQVVSVQDRFDQIQHSFQMAFSASSVSQLQGIGCLLIKF